MSSLTLTYLTIPTPNPNCTLLSLQPTILTIKLTSFGTQPLFSASVAHSITVKTLINHTIDHQNKSTTCSFNHTPIDDPPYRPTFYLSSPTFLRDGLYTVKPTNQFDL
ncbi:hypothetical protein CROQUDRAFT_95363 [Cronartium quercuum f. sp. fusiforme G11]|uniref:Uncharacterized protein n=1 Tax=Cronartium quercuum f. sp. fusiforme G11 TaxID=708437 RepID=A0A9P6NH88_9BASI|nr:hypothetical protein CROQUDRAFT_95363 [Cronartium quercuum f. sp. fusiforme G11]